MGAGLTGSMILVPQGVAFATIAGMPPEFGLYAAMVPVIIAALFGSSWHMVSGPTTAISIVVFASLSPMAEPGSAQYVQLALSLSFMSGVCMLALGWLRLGSLMNFVSHTVVVGFTAGAAVLIAASLLSAILGGLVKMVGAGAYDRILGGLFGMARAGLILLMLTLLGGLTALPKTPAWQTSLIHGYLEQAAGKLKPWLPTDLAALIQYH